MFSLGFCAAWIERHLKLSPLGILLTCSVLACVGLNLVSGVDTLVGAFAALLIYAVGKTFFWPTMLAVASDRFPRTGAVAISIMGGIGMMSAGLVGSEGLGYFKDRFSGEALQEADPNLFAEVKASEPSKFLVFPEATGIDGKVLGSVGEELTELRKSNPAATPADLPERERTIMQASIAGDRKTLIADSAIPATMAVIYLALLIYFKSIGGYRPIHISEQERREREADENA
jgi:hypothetical protein